MHGAVGATIPLVDQASDGTIRMQFGILLVPDVDHPKPSQSASSCRHKSEDLLNLDAGTALSELGQAAVPNANGQLVQKAPDLTNWTEFSAIPCHDGATSMTRKALETWTDRRTKLRADFMCSFKTRLYLQRDDLGCFDA